MSIHHADCGVSCAPSRGLPVMIRDWIDDSRETLVILERKGRVSAKETNHSRTIPVKKQ